MQGAARRDWWQDHEGSSLLCRDDFDKLPNDTVEGLKHMGGCQNYGPFLDPYDKRHLIFRVPEKGP